MVEPVAETMSMFVEQIKKTYKKRRLITADQWPPVSGEKLINLQLVQADKKEGFRAGLPQHGARGDKTEIKRTPILYSDLFKADEDEIKLIIEGNAGIGKTTLCTILAEEWADKKILTQFDCVLLLPLREKLVSSASSLSDLLALLHPHKGTRDSVTNQLEITCGKGVLIIADGWDELSEENRSKESFLYNLLFGHLLPSASVLLTSRPSASALLHKLQTVDCLVEIVGFSEENVKQYIESEFEQCPEKAASLIEQVESNPVIQSICSVPLNCAIVCHLWHTSEQAFPSTLTELYIKVVLNIILRNVQKKFPEFSVCLSLNNFDNIASDLQEPFWLTCKFAYKCLLLDKLVFTEDDLSSHIPQVLDSSDKFLCFGLLQSARSLLPTGHGLSFHFLHLTIQEFLAALHIATLPNEEKLKVCEAHAKSDRFSMVWRFVFGLVSKERPSCSAKVISGSHGLWYVFLPLVSSGFNTLLYDRYKLCCCAFEASDPFLAAKVLRNQSWRQLNFNTAYDRMAGFYVLRHTTGCTEPLRVYFRGCLSNTLLKDLGDILSSSKLQVKSLTLTENKLSDNGATDFIERAISSFSGLSKLDLRHNNLTGIMLSFVHTPSFKSLTWLYLSHNPLGVIGMQSLEAAVEAGVLVNLWELELDNSLTDDADINGALLTTLLASIASNCIGLESLSLSDNVLSVPGMCAIGQNIAALKNLSNLYLKNTHIDANALSELTSRFNFVQISSLSLDNNPLGCGGFFKLLRYPIKSLDLQNTTDTSSLDSYTDTSEMIKQSSTVISNDLMSLDLKNNNFSGERVQILVKILQVCQSLKCLYCWNCSLTSADIIVLVHHLKSASTCCKSLREWYLMNNSIDDKGVSALVEDLKLFPALEDLYLDGNPLSKESKQRLDDYLKAYRETCKEAKRAAMLSEWERTGLPPHDKQMASEFHEMWDWILEELARMAEELGNLLHFTEPMNQISLKSISPASSSASDDESFHSASEELDEPVEHHPTDGDHSTSLTVVSPHRMDQQETNNPQHSTSHLASEREEDHYSTPVLPPQEQSTGVRQLIEKSAVSDSQLDTEIREADMILLATHFDNVETYTVLLGLPPSEQQDVKDQKMQHNTQTAMFLALRLWKKHRNAATYRALVEIVLRVGGEDLALQICKYCHQNVVASH